MRKFVSACLLSLMLFALISSFPLVSPNYVADSDFSSYYVEEIETGQRVFNVAVDSTGKLYIATTTNTVWVSTDNGKTWTDTGKSAVASYPRMMFVDSNDNLWVSLSSEDFYKYDGSSWTLNFTMTGGRPWFMTENPTTGSLFVCNYTASTPSGVDGGLVARCKSGIWTYVLNYSDYDVSYDPSKPVQGHCVYCEPSNGWIYAISDSLSGFDYNAIFVSKDDGDSWSVLWNFTTDRGTGDASARFIDMWSDGGYVYFGGDAGATYRLACGDNDWDNAQVVFAFHHQLGWETRANHWVYDGAYYSDTGLHIQTTKEGKVYASGDGANWVSIWDDSSASCWGLTERISPYFTDVANNKLYRVNFPRTEAEACHLCKVVESTQSTVTETITVGNRTDSSIGFGQTVLKDVSVTLIGRSYKNHVTNPSFETGDTTGWSFRRGDAWSITSSDAYDGIYSVNATMATGFFMTQVFGLGSANTENRTWVVSCYARAKDTQTHNFRWRLFYQNTTSGWQEYPARYFDLDVTWRRCIYRYARIPDWATEMKIAIDISKNTGTWFLIDAFQVERFDYGELGEIYEQQCVANLVPLEFFTNTKNTTNPSITIDGQTFPHSGSLVDGESSFEQSYSGYLVGGTKITATVSGSCQVDVQISGERVLSVSNAYIEEKSGNVYVGKYFGTPAFTYNAEDKLIVLSAGSIANVTSASLSGDSLTIDIDAYPGYASAIKVYCGERGEPIEIYTVNGTITWSYNASTTILTLNVTHIGSTRILIYWKFPGDLNDDGIVDIYDLARICKAYRATSGSSNWDESCDINGDEIVDFYDLAIHGENYGKSQP